MKKNKNDEQIQRIFQDKTILPEKVEQAKQEAFSRIRANACKVPVVDLHPRKKFGMKRIGASAAAAALLLILIGIRFPVYAREIPFLGNLFAAIGNRTGFEGDYEKYASPAEGSEEEQKVQKEEKSSESAESEDSVTSKTTGVISSCTRNGITVSLSEVYCNEKVLYFSLLMENEKPFPKTAELNGNPEIGFFLNSEMYSYIHVSYNPAYDGLPDQYPAGTFLDEHTYAVMVRIPLDETCDTWSPEADHAEDRTSFENAKIPDYFQVEFQIAEIRGCLAEPDPTKDEKTYGTSHNPGMVWWVDGPWKFNFDVNVDHRENRQVDVDAGEEIGCVSFTKTPFELMAHFEKKESDFNYVIVPFDAEGNLLSTPAQSNEFYSFAIRDADLSSITFYVVKYDDYMDRIKGIKADGAGDEEYQKVVSEHAIYTGIADFPETES